MTVTNLKPRDHRISFGEGVMTWDAGERRSDRYGTVWIMPEGETSMTMGCPKSLLRPANEWEGQGGDLLAVVKIARTSNHIGDLFHGLHPETPEVGEIINLGTGLLFFEPAYGGGYQVGLAPLDGRATWWLNPKALYRAHEQTVELFFHPTE